ncbi:MAG: Ldh family oxidoreductase, partial [Bacteroidetes bacterium]|nr:Ldh family oxidoreductase [Bacteroidota bacterium]
MQKRNIQIKEITELSQKALLKTGLTTFDVDIIIQHLLQEELLDKGSHGFYRLPNILKYLKNNKISADIEINKIEGNCTRINGNNNIGLIVAQKACTTAIMEAKNHSITMTVATNYI